MPSHLNFILFHFGCCAACVLLLKLYSLASTLAAAVSPLPLLVSVLVVLVIEMHALLFIQLLSPGTDSAI